MSSPAWAPAGSDGQYGYATAAMVVFWPQAHHEAVIEPAQCRVGGDGDAQRFGPGGLGGGDDRDVDEVFDPTADCWLSVPGVRAEDRAELVCEVVGDWEDPVVRSDESFDVEWGQWRDDVWCARHCGAHDDVDVEGCERRRAESCVEVHPGSLGLLLQWRDSGDVEVEVVAEVDAERALERVEGVVDIGVRGVEEDIDVLAVSGRGEAGQECSCALEYPPVGVSGAEQPGEGAVIGELTLELVD